ncbi:MAG: threonine/serine exporter family protein [Tissierellia bacterium]|nr:threonine/serine exporter family protein [Tissierellia bacterium]
MTYLKDNEREEVKKLLVLATLAGRLMLKSGAETYRVEDTVTRICQSRKEIQYVDAFVIPTGIFISLEYKGELISYIKRVKTISINLNKIALVNEFSRNFVNSQMSIDDGIKEIKRISKINIYSNVTKALFGAIASSFFCLLFQGTKLDFISSFIVSFIVSFLINHISRLKVSFFIDKFIGSVFISILSYFLIKLGIGENLDKVIIGAIMPLVPGVAITNAIRDTMSGDFMSGLSRGMEAVFSALAIAFGVGIVLIFS